MITKKMISTFVAVIFVVFCFLPLVSNAAPTTVMEPTTYNPNQACPAKCGDTDESCKKYCGDYQVSDVMKLGVRISEIILGVVGSLALLAFVIGGVMFLVSGGNKSLVERGKSTLIGAVIGLLVVFASYTIINFTAKALGVETGKNIFNSGWF